MQLAESVHLGCVRLLVVGPDAWNGRPEGDGVTGFGEETSAEGGSEGIASSSVLVAGDSLAVLNRHDSRGWVSSESS